MPVPDLSGVPPWAEFQDLKDKINDIVSKYNNLLVNLDSLNVVSLTADHITAGTIDANVVTIRSDLAAGAFIQIDGGGMRINNGSYDTFTANINGYVTMTGALIRSQSGYPMVVMDPNSDLIGAYASPSSYITINPTASPVGSPQFLVAGGGGSMFMYQQSSQSIISSSYDLTVKASNDINLIPGVPGGHVRVGFDELLDTNTSNTLYQQLLGKASSGVQTSSAGPFNGGIPTGTQLMVAGGGTVTWVGIAAHSHVQN
ncbi:hypothetical protein [Paenibacillus sp. XY044]|uniref:hypothetical protein n=1 Tax=Paenibacillus sp. XY044 TaxID=2026089 RepID=UPI000B98E6FC|nr:hypothetical protein [Paenibacillus sp. XY044]OZB90056.1 hypothetical protein CJP46_35345 [Paenibacillus sp. XY044]